MTPRKRGRIWSGVSGIEFLPPDCTRGHPVRRERNALEECHDLVGLAESFAQGYVSSEFKDVIVFGVLIAFMLLRPQGLLGTPAINKV